MAKKTLLSEGNIRKFMKLAAIEPLTENFLAEAEDEDGLKKLEETHADLIEERKTQLAQLEATMQNEIDIDLHSIKESQLPDDVTPEQIVPILPILS